MYGIFTYIWLIFMVNVGKYTIHGWYGYIELKIITTNGNVGNYTKIDGKIQKSDPVPRWHKTSEDWFTDRRTPSLKQVMSSPTYVEISKKGCLENAGPRNQV